MSKRFTDTTIWKRQKWFKKLPLAYKLAFKYLTDECDNAGFWKIDFDDLLEDLGLEEFDLEDFICKCNTDKDKISGKNIHRSRILVVNEKMLWLTGFIKFQYESKDHKIKPTFNLAKSALEQLAFKNLFKYAQENNFFILYEPFRTVPNPSEPFPTLRNPAGKGKGKGTTVSNSTIVQKDDIDESISSGENDFKGNDDQKEFNGTEKRKNNSAPPPENNPPPLKKKGPPKPKDFESDCTYRMKAHYTKWCLKEYEFEPQIIKGAFTALVELAKFFRKKAKAELKIENATEIDINNEAVSQFKKLLEEDWKLITDNFLKRTDIKNINSQINNILSHINAVKNGQSNGKQSWQNNAYKPIITGTATDAGKF